MSVDVTNEDNVTIALAETKTELKEEFILGVQQDTKIM